MMFYDTRPWTDLDHLYEADACLRIPHNAKTHKAHTLHQTTPTPQRPPPPPPAAGREQNGEHEGSEEPPLKRVKDGSASRMEVDVAASGGGGRPQATSVLDVCETFPFWSDARGSPDYCMATYLFWLYLTPPDQTPKVVSQSGPANGWMDGWQVCEWCVFVCVCECLWCSGVVCAGHPADRPPCGAGCPAP